jgi:hypothetical protein
MKNGRPDRISRLAKRANLVRRAPEIHYWRISPKVATFHRDGKKSMSKCKHLPLGLAILPRASCH